MSTNLDNNNDALFGKIEGIDRFHNLNLPPAEDMKKDEDERPSFSACQDTIDRLHNINDHIRHLTKASSYIRGHLMKTVGEIKNKEFPEMAAQETIEEVNAYLFDCEALLSELDENLHKVKKLSQSSIKGTERSEPTKYIITASPAIVGGGYTTTTANKNFYGSLGKMSMGSKMSNPCGEIELSGKEDTKPVNSFFHWVFNKLKRK